MNWQSPHAGVEKNWQSSHAEAGKAAGVRGFGERAGLTRGVRIIAAQQAPGARAAPPSLKS